MLNRTGLESAWIPKSGSIKKLVNRNALVNDDLKAWYADLEVYSENSIARMKAVRSRVTADQFQGGPSLGEVLRSQDDLVHPVCRSNQGENGAFTVASVIMTLGDQPFLQLTVGPPDESEYGAFRFTSLPD